MCLSCLRYRAWNRRSGEKRRRRSQTTTTHGDRSGDTRPRRPRSSTPTPPTTRGAWCCRWSLPSGRSFHYCSVCVNFELRGPQTPSRPWTAVTLLCTTRARISVSRRHFRQGAFELQRHMSVDCRKSVTADACHRRLYLSCGYRFFGVLVVHLCFFFLVKKILRCLVMFCQWSL